MLQSGQRRSGRRLMCGFTDHESSLALGPLVAVLRRSAAITRGEPDTTRSVFVEMTQRGGPQKRARHGPVSLPSWSVSACSMETSQFRTCRSERRRGSRAVVQLRAAQRTDASAERTVFPTKEGAEGGEGWPACRMTRYARSRKEGKNARREGRGSHCVTTGGGTGDTHDAVTDGGIPATVLRCCCGGRWARGTASGCSFRVSRMQS